MVIHCCHCTWCQRETGTAFALNAVVEADAIRVLTGEVEVVEVPSQSGNGQSISRCVKCRVALWSNYFQAGPRIRFLRVGTLERASEFTPDIHIYTSTKLPWVGLPEGARAVPEFYDPKVVWSADSLARFARVRAT
jgi:hypothetical protein